jgi:3-methylcrotonyl-CoA carboxylase beta subunit
MTDAEIAAFKKPTQEQFDKQSSAYYSTARLWDDGIIDPAHTRDVLGLAISASLNAEINDTHYGVFRM